MSNGQSVLAPTPIVRITSEQLEYLIGRLRQDEMRERKLWRVRVSTVVQSLGAQVNPLLGIDPTRVGLLVWSNTNQCWMGPIGTTALNTGIPINSGFTTGQQPLMRDDFGWQITRGWEAFNNVAGTTFSIIEIFGAVSWTL